jgi:hypothetical protein
MYRIFCLMALFAMSLPLRADEPKPNAGALAQTIAPYITEQTVALLHFDVGRLRSDALVGKLVALSSRGAPDSESTKSETIRWLTDLSKAGSRDIFVLFDLADLLSGPFAIVPLGDHADSDAIVTMLSGKIPGLGPLDAATGRPTTVEKLDHAIYAGSRKTLTRIKEHRSAPRPEVASAFAAAGEAAAQLLLIPSADAHRVIEELFPTLPSEVGGGPMSVVTNGAQWAAISVDAAPNVSIRMVIQSKDASAARTLSNWIGNAAKKLGQFFPQSDKLAALITPTVNDNRINLTLDSASPALAEMLSVSIPRVADARDRNVCVNNMKLIAVAFHAHHDAHQSFPAVANFSNDGKPLLSWRVHLLPYLDQEKLYKEFHLDEPWDSEHNRKLIERMPNVFRCPSSRRSSAGDTTYLVPVGDAMVFTGGPKGVAIKDIADGTANTICLVDVNDDRAVPWTKPDDLRIDPNNPSSGLFGHHVGGCVAAFADGSAHVLSQKIDAKTLNALFTRNGGEVIGELP